MKRIFPTLVLLALVSGVAGFGQGSVVATRSASLQQGRSASIRFIPRLIRESNRRFRYTIKARYPQATGAVRDARLVKLNQKLRNLIVKEVTEFKGSFTEPSERLGPVGSYYDSEYIVTLATSDLVSIAFGVSTYGEGAAHPNHNTFVFNYDLAAGRELKLADLFKRNADYLKVISDYAMKDLAEQLGPDPDMDWIREGAGPKEENYKSWNLSNKGLEINFDPYQVASYAAGPHEVVIPFSVLKDVIDQNGPLGRMGN